MSYRIAEIPVIAFPRGLGSLAAWKPFVRGARYTHPMLNYRVDANGTSYDLTTGKKLDGWAIHDRLIRFVSSGESAKQYNEGVDDVAFHNRDDGKWWKARTYDHPLLRFRTDSKQKPFDLDTGKPLTNKEVQDRTAAWAAATESRVRTFGKSRSFFEDLGNAIAINARNAVKKPFKNLILPLIGVAVTAALIPGISGTLLGSVGKGIIGASGKVIGGGLSVLKKGGALIASKLGVLKKQQTGEPATSAEEEVWAREIEAEADAAARAAGHSPGTRAYDEYVAAWYEMMYGDANNAPSTSSGVVPVVIDQIIDRVLPSSPVATPPYGGAPGSTPYPPNYGGPVYDDTTGGAPGAGFNLGAMSPTTMAFLAMGAVVGVLAINNSRRS